MSGADVTGPGVVRARVTRLGSRGEGVIETPQGTIFAAYALPGELVDVQGEGERAALVAVIEPSSARIAPVCPLFGACGACAVQTLAPAPYGAWKRDLVVTALQQAGVGRPEIVTPLVDAHGAGRRRVTIHARASGRGEGLRSIAGFMRARSHDVIDVAACPILAPGMARAFDVARAVALTLASLDKPLDVQATATEGGLDVDVRGAGPLSEPLQHAMSALAEQFDLARLTHHGVIVAQRRPPTLRMGVARVVAPGGGFLQATTMGETALAALALDAVGEARRVADLFCGCGAFALRLAQRAEVLALDSHAPAIAALERAARTPGLKRVSAQARDLFRRPLRTEEMAGLDAIVFDPPRAGASAQAEQIAASDTPVVVAASCHPGTFSRDAKILIDGGYRLERVTPVDQFRHSAHVELVAVFTKPKPARKKRGLLSR
jgi:23S rRNA (uracil1939-C5)-methyltransferase